MHDRRISFDNEHEDRFKILIRLNHYSEEEMVLLIRQRAKRLGWAIDESSVGELAKRSRGVPRLGVRSMSEKCSTMTERCSGTIRKMKENSAESVRKMNENRNENCADLSKRSLVLLHSSESGIEQPVQAVRQADSDDQLIELWLHGRPDHTQRAY